MDRSDHKIICQIIKENARVIDLGCGDGNLLTLLTKYKNIDGSGIEISAEGVRKSISKGLSVIQGNLEEIISNYPENHFDYSGLGEKCSFWKKGRTIIGIKECYSFLICVEQKTIAFSL